MKTVQRRVPNSEMIMHHMQTGQEGPRVVITANLHGDECTGFAVVISLLEELSALLSKGEVFLYPSLNPTGLQQMLRTFPADGKDLNRLFPGSPSGSSAEKHVHTIWSSIRSSRPDLLLDLHTDSSSSIPYVILDRAISSRVQEHVIVEMATLAKASGLTLVWEYREKEYRQYQLEKSLSGAALNLLGIPSLTLEVGPRRSMHRNANRMMKDAVSAILSAKGMLKKSISAPRLGIEGDWFRVAGPIAHHAGVFIPSVDAGHMLGRSEEIGRIYSTMGAELEVIRAHFPAVVLSLPDRCWVRDLQSCATLAMERHPEP